MTRVGTGSLDAICASGQRKRHLATRLNEDPGGTGGGERRERGERRVDPATPCLHAGRAVPDVRTAWCRGPSPSQRLSGLVERSGVDRPDEGSPRLDVGGGGPQAAPGNPPAAPSTAGRRA